MILIRLLFVFIAALVCVNFVHADSTVVNVTEELSGVDERNWIRSTALNMIGTTANGDAYVVGNSGVFGFYNRSVNVTEQLNGTDGNNWVGTIGLNGVAVANGGAYVTGSSNGVFGFYNRSYTSTSANCWITDAALKQIFVPNGCTYFMNLLDFVQG